MFSSDDLQALFLRAREAGLTDPDARRAALLALPPVIRDGLPRAEVPIDQLRSDLRALNDWPTLIGHTPLIIRWLAQAVATTAPNAREALRAMLIFEGYGDLAQSVAVGAQRRVDVLPELARARRGTLVIYCRDDASDARQLGKALRLRLEQDPGALASRIDVSELGFLQPGDRWTIRAKAALADFECVLLCFGAGLSLLERDPILVQPSCRLIPVLLPGAQASRLPEWVHDHTVFTLPDEPRQMGPWIDAIVEFIGPAARPISRDWTACNPYRGLRAFEPEHTDQFFGRGVDTARLVDRVRDGITTQRRLHTLVGASGSGASSVVRAGLVPALRRHGIGDGRDWSVLILRDADAPLQGLAEAALDVIGVDPDAGFHAAMLADAQALHAQVARRVGEERLLIVVDQIEELLAQLHRAQVEGDTAYVLSCQAFFANLMHAARTPLGPVSVLLTVRADHLHRLLAVDIGLNDAISAGQVLLPAMRADALQAAIERPALQAGRAFEPGVVAALVAEARARPGRLPALQLALDQMWRTAPGDLLDADTRHAQGPLAAVVDRHTQACERAIGRMLPALRVEPHLHMLFARLVRIDAGAPDTRRAVIRRTLNTPAVVEKVIDRLVDDGVLSVNFDGRFDRVELAHEALLHGWAALRAWCEIQHTGLRYAGEVARAANAWQAAGQTKAMLWRGARAQLLIELEATVPAIGPAVQPFRAAVRRAHLKQRRITLTLSLAVLAMALTAMKLWG